MPHRRHCLHDHFRFVIIAAGVNDAAQTVYRDLEALGSPCRGNIHPHEIRGALALHLKVFDSAAIGIPDAAFANTR
jgi:hypothetical protein